MQATETYTKRIFILLSICLFTYTTLRASLMSFTHDESLTYLMIKFFTIKISSITHHENLSQFNLIADRITNVYSANNHILNSIAMKISSLLFGDSELSLRLPNLIAHVFFLLFSYKLLKRQGNDVVTISAFVILNANPFILDFFSLARGYGLSITFMTISLYYFIKAWEQEQRMRYFLLAYLMCFAAIYSNFTLFNFYIALIACHVLLLLLKGRAQNSSFKKMLYHNGYLISFNVLLFLPTTGVLALMKAAKQLYFGSGTLFNSTYSLAWSVFYKNTHLRFAAILLCIGVFVFLLALLALLIPKFRNNNLAVSFLIPSMVLWFSILLVLLQHALLKTPLPESRTGLFFVPMVVVSLAFLQKQLRRIRLQKLNLYLIAFVAFFSVVNLCQAMNLRYVLYCPYDARTKEVYQIIMNDAKLSKVNIMTDWWFEPTLNYYRVSRKCSKICPVLKHHSTDTKLFDYFYFFEQAPITNAPLQIVKNYRDTKTLLAKKF